MQIIEIASIGGTLFGVAVVLSTFVLIVYNVVGTVDKAFSIAERFRRLRQRE